MFTIYETTTDSLWSHLDDVLITANGRQTVTGIPLGQLTFLAAALFWWSTGKLFGGKVIDPNVHPRAVIRTRPPTTVVAAATSRQVTCSSRWGMNSQERTTTNSVLLIMIGTTMLTGANERLV